MRFKNQSALLALAGVATAVALSACTPADSADKPTKAEAKQAAKHAMPVKAKAILAEFEANEAAADLKYKGKTLKVTGIVDKIDTEFLDEDQYVIQIGGGSDFEIFTVNADDQSQADVASIKKGQKITVVGEFEDGGDLGVELKNATIL